MQLLLSPFTVIYLPYSTPFLHSLYISVSTVTLKSTQPLRGKDSRCECHSCNCHTPTVCRFSETQPPRSIRAWPSFYMNCLPYLYLYAIPFPSSSFYISSLLIPPCPLRFVVSFCHTVIPLTFGCLPIFLPQQTTSFLLFNVSAICTLRLPTSHK
jgi:hypothetical protein